MEVCIRFLQVSHVSLEQISMCFLESKVFYPWKLQYSYHFLSSSLLLFFIFRSGSSLRKGGSKFLYVILIDEKLLDFSFLLTN